MRTVLGRAAVVLERPGSWLLKQVACPQSRMDIVHPAGKHTGAEGTLLPLFATASDAAKPREPDPIRLAHATVDNAILAGVPYRTPPSGQFLGTGLVG